jgi:hypothetical protein
LQPPELEETSTEREAGEEGLGCAEMEEDEEMAKEVNRGENIHLRNPLSVRLCVTDNIPALFGHIERIFGQDLLMKVGWMV